ncbi:hypothetical protein, partial [Sphingomonas metalli]|uniref:hypothetical protein n=1 Tax=Sphingomonas metalli TaxID=1779358 RepID=UPI001E3EE36C
QGTTIVCTWEGTADVQVGGERGPGKALDHGYEFVWPGMAGNTDKLVFVQVTGTAAGASDPLRNLDCREKGVARGEMFSAETVESLKPYGVLRYLDWSAVNGNPQNVVWSKRTRVEDLNQAMAPLGVALEYQIALANRLNAEPWFNIPWNADEDYVRRMAQLVHDGIPSNRQVYVELSNEVWNFSFGATAQAQREGLAEGLTTDAFKAVLLRHAEKTRWAMTIWKQVFADRPGQLVRVAATQNDNPWTAEVELGEAKLAADVDALAIAPYFGGDLFSPEKQKGVTDTGVLLSALGADLDRIMTNYAAKNAEIAKKYGVRLIGYEGGQHLVDGNVAVVAAVNRSAGMYDLYKRYLTTWKSQYNDTLVLFASTGAISGWGAWGLREYAGQPLAETPKRRAALEFGR